MPNRERFQWRVIPWLTLTLFAVIWCIHIASRQLGLQSELRASYGLTPGSYLTYLTHAFQHADLLHIIGNSFFLLIFGSVVEAQVSRKKFVVVVLLGILAGGLSTMLSPQSAELNSDELPVGLSAATSTLTIVGISVLTYYWYWHKVMFYFTLPLSGLALFEIFIEAWTRASVPSSAMLATVLLIVGLGAIRSYRRRKEKMLSGLLSILWISFPLYELTGTSTWSYGAAAHLAGAITGAVVMLPVLMGGIVSPRTNSLKGFVTESCNNWLVRPTRAVQASIEASRTYQNRTLTAVMFTCLLVVVVSAITYFHGHDIYSFYYDFYFN